MNEDATSLETNLRCHKCDTQMYFKKISSKYYVATCPNEKQHSKKATTKEENAGKMQLNYV